MKSDNSRIVVTNLPKQHDGSIHSLYEKLYCARSDMENRINEQQLYLFADRTSCSQIRANQFRLNFILVRICADAGFALVGIERYAVRQRTMLDAASETFENRFTG